MYRETRVGNKSRLHPGSAYIAKVWRKFLFSCDKPAAAGHLCCALCGELECRGGISPAVTNLLLLSAVVAGLCREGQDMEQVSVLLSDSTHFCRPLDGGGQETQSHVEL